MNETEWSPLAPRLARLPVFQSHGRNDSILPFAMGTALRDFLSQSKANVDFQAFDGGHEIPQEVLTRLAGLLQKLAED